MTEATYLEGYNPARKIVVRTIEANNGYFTLILDNGEVLFATDMSYKFDDQLIISVPENF